MAKQVFQLIHEAFMSQEFEEKWKKYLIEMTGNEGICLSENCGGKIVKKVVGTTSFNYIYSIPYCKKCNREYLFAQNVPAVGHAEFENAMNIPYGM